MADRLQELLQQRALIKEHLAWIEGEIAAASGRAPAFPPAQPAPASSNGPGPNPIVAAAIPIAGARPVAPVAVPATPVAATANDPEAEALFAKFVAEERRTPPPDKKGCWMIFWAALVLFVGLSFGLFYIFHR